MHSENSTREDTIVERASVSTLWVYDVVIVILDGVVVPLVLIATLRSSASVGLMKATLCL